jgi:hypothetical protein
MKSYLFVSVAPIRWINFNFSTLFRQSLEGLARDVESVHIATKECEHGESND